MRYCLDARTARDHFPGVGRYTVNLARALVPRLEATEHLSILYDSTGRLRLDAITAAHPRVQLVEAPVSPFALRQQWRVPALLRSLAAGLYHSPYYLMPFRPGVPSVVTIHDLIPLRFPQYFSAVDRLVFAVTVRLAVRTARTTIAVSEATARDLTQFLGLSTERIVVIPEAPDPIFCPQPADRVAALRSRWHLPDRYALYFGSNKPHKSLVRLVEAWALLRSHALPLIIAGLWDERYPDAKRLVETHGLGDLVRFVGPVGDADLPALYGGATLFVFPSEWEGFGLPVIEAMACGVPVACTNTASVADDAAVTFNPRRVEAMVVALESLLKDAEQRADYAARGLRRAAQFSWSDAAAKTLSAYRALAP